MWHSTRPTFCSPASHNLSNFWFGFAHNVTAEAATEETCTQRLEVGSDGDGAAGGGCGSKSDPFCNIAHMTIYRAQQFAIREMMICCGP